ncbi:MAG: CRISPR-associated helicase Cas3' [Acidobacteriota bacterium]|nr:CRISPR-associated helicase Cas3' [Acidobacteriota bacterium]
MAQNYPPQLLAKSYDKREYKEPPAHALLVRHTTDVVEAGQALCEAIGRIAFECADLRVEEFEEFGIALKANCFAQDLGKANSHFLEMLATSGRTDQLLRHEVVSAVLLTRPPLVEWWASIPIRESLRWSALWGATGHHRKYHVDTAPTLASAMTVFGGHDDFKELLALLKATLRTSKSLSLPQDFEIADETEAQSLLRKLRREFKSRVPLFADDNEIRTLALIKGFGIAADVAASAVAKPKDWPTKNNKEYSLAQFVKSEIESPGHSLRSDQLKELIASWERRRIEGGEEIDEQIMDFQNSLASRATDKFLTLVQAGCGSGKSLGAYRWALKWSERLTSEGRTIFRLFFLLPTTGTATEQFKDYALESGIENAALTHSRSEIDLERIIETADQEDASEKNEHDKGKAARESLKAQQDKIEALNLWSTPLVVGSTDTVLGLMANSLRSVCSLPAILTSAIVFDEIHAYDDQMFGHLLVFLKNFPNLPVLLMTASLPDHRKKALNQVRGDSLQIVRGPKDFETLKRYLINDSAGDLEVEAAIEKCIGAGGKVLWVRNRVRWANRAYEYCKKFESRAYVDVYHSRFRYPERAERHAQVIKAFKSKSKDAAILVATQVAEMSLDLSADLLITDIAPVPSLIQRMGRLNRRLKPKNVDPERHPEDYCKWAYVRPLPTNESGMIQNSPYDADDYALSRIWLKKLTQPARPLGQSDLADVFFNCQREAGIANTDFDMRRAETEAVFFSGLWQTRVGETRGDSYTVRVLLKEDADKLEQQNLRGKLLRKWLREHEVSITYRPEVSSWQPRIAGLPVAPFDKVKYCYDPKTKRGTGARWVDEK